MSAGLSDGDFTRILTETPEGQHVLKAFFDSWNQSHETDIIKKFQIALNKAYLEAQEPRNKRIDIVLIISLINGFFEFIRKNHTYKKNVLEESNQTVDSNVIEQSSISENRCCDRHDHKK